VLAKTRTWRWIRALILWLLDARRFWPTWFFAGVWVVFIIGSQLPGTDGDRMRYCGLALQLAGISTVAFVLLDRRRLFNLPSSIKNLRDWLDRCPRWAAKPQTTSIKGTGGISVGGGGKVSGWIDVPPESSIEDRLIALVANVERLKPEQDGIAKELQEESRKRIEAIDSERRIRESAVIDIRRQLGTLGAGGLQLEWAGVSWLILGVVLATAPSEIAGWLKWF
jgi:hypothetical protein